MDPNVRDAIKAVFARLRAMPKEEFHRNLEERGGGCLSSAMMEMADFMIRLASRLSTPMKVEQPTGVVDTDFSYSHAPIADAANDALFAMAA